MMYTGTHDKRLKMEVEPGELNEQEVCSKLTIEDLPDEVLEYIISLVSPYKDLKECMLVCKRWHQNVKNVVRLRNHNLTKAINSMDVAWETITPIEMAPTITKRYSHSACYHENSMYVFGGCTSSLTTFNDLWRLDLNKRQWIRPLTVGTYPSPKACATMVQYKDALILFGGWTHPSPYPIYQAWRLFNELHVYNIVTNRWICINTTSSPPAMAGHSASVHGDVMVVFGGLKSNLNGQYSSSNDVWCFNFQTQEWHQKQTSISRPHVRYGQSQISLGETHALILGGCGGPNMMFSDVWLLTMVGDVWQWQEIEVRNPEFSAMHMWCHPACKVGDQIVMMSRHPKATKTYLPCAGHKPNQRVNGLPQVWVPPRGGDQDVGMPLQSAPTASNDRNGQRRFSQDVNVNGQRGSLLRTHSNIAQKRHDPKIVNNMCIHKSSLSFSNDNNNRPSTSGLQSGSSCALPQSKKDTFESKSNADSASNHVRLLKNHKVHSAVTPHGLSLSNNDSLVGVESYVTSFEMAAFREQSHHTCPGPSRVRERQLQALQRFEDKIRNRGHNQNRERAQTQAISNITRLHRAMAVYVMDITHVLNESYVKWLAIRSEESPVGSPEETILYTLVVGRGELIMFGGIQKDAHSITSEVQPLSTNNVSNSLHFISAPHGVI